MFTQRLRIFKKKTYKQKYIEQTMYERFLFVEEDRLQCYSKIFVHERKIAKIEKQRDFLLINFVDNGICDYE